MGDDDEYMSDDDDWKHDGNLMMCEDDKVANTVYERIIT